ncbi:MAG: phosphoglycerol transferase MdoB-like AlkP superfamily enzyme [Motiliproteus sp.]|jgi:phosphoglycerol transferase MdoB-like AlkP superfamily enzyme
MAIFYNLLIVNSFLLLVAVFSKVLLSLLHPPLRELLLSSDGLYALVWGLRMDGALVALLATLWLIFDLSYCGNKRHPRLIRKLPLAVAAIWLVVATTSDQIYFIESGRHVTFEVFTGAGEEWSLLLTAISQYSIHVLVAVALLLVSLLLLRATPLKQPYSQGKIKPLIAVLLIWPVIAVSIVRGGWNDAPQSPMSTYKIGSNSLAELAWSAPYSIAYYLAKGQNQAAKKITPELSAPQLEQLAAVFYRPADPLTQPLKPANVVVVLLESWAAADMLSYAGNIDATPFFDSLRQTSLTTRATYANGFRTAEGIFATLCAYPNPIGGSVAGTQLQNHHYRCLPQILQQQGWETHFIQGSGKGIIGTFAQSIGFKSSHGKTDYLFDAPRNYWGYMDDSIYRFSLAKIKAAKPPYFVTINTGTTHDRALPEGSDYAFGQADANQARASVLHHADQSLKHFITELKQTETRPTLVVLIADHTAGIPSRGLNQNSIPFLMFALNADLPARKLDIVNSQRDITPTILDWMGGSTAGFSGHSLLDSNYPGFADFSVGETLSWVENSSLIELNATTGALQECYGIDADTVSTETIDCESEQRAAAGRARDFLFYSQQLLFEGRTVDF